MLQGSSSLGATPKVTMFPGLRRFESNHPIATTSVDFCWVRVVPAISFFHCTTVVHPSNSRSPGMHYSRHNYKCKVRRPNGLSRRVTLGITDFEYIRSDRRAAGRRADRRHFWAQGAQRVVQQVLLPHKWDLTSGPSPPPPAAEPPPLVPPPPPPSFYIICIVLLQAVGPTCQGPLVGPQRSSTCSRARCRRCCGATSSPTNRCAKGGVVCGRAPWSIRSRSRKRAASPPATG